MSNKRWLPLLILLPLFFCCKTKKTITDGAGEYTISPLTFPDIKSPGDIGELIEEVKLIDIQTGGGALLAYIKKVVLTSNGQFILQDKNGVYHFDGDGKFIRQYGRNGSGPMEYVELADIAIDDADNVIILDAMNKVLVFDTRTGNAVGEVVLESNQRSDAIAPASGGFFIISTKDDPEPRPRDCLILFDKNGKKVSETVPCDQYVLSLNLLVQIYGNNYALRPLNDDQAVLFIGEDGVKPLYNIDFEGKTADKGTILDQGGNIDLGNYFASRTYKFVSNFVPSKDHISFTYMGPEGTSFGAVYFVQSKKGVTLAAPDKMTVPFRFSAADDRYLYAIWDKYSDEDMSIRADDLTKYLAQRLGYLEEDENQKLVAVRFKTDI